MRQTVSFVNITDVMHMLGEALGEDFLARQDVWEYFNGVSYGDASYTLVGNNFALAILQDYMHNIHYIDADVVAQRFWELVGEQDYINMEA